MSTVHSRALGVLFLSAMFFLGSPLSASGSDLTARVDAELDSLRDELISVRRDLHRHPEVSGQEERTAGVVADRLRALKLEVRTDVGGHGVVAVLKGGRPGPVVAYRADMDAVTSDAPDPVEFASVNPGVRHICGHDVHTTVGLGIAEALAAVRADLPGTVVFFFQPAEESAVGAKAMIADGALDGPRPQAIFAVHSHPLPAGSIGTQSGPLLAGRDLAQVTLKGDGDPEAASAVVIETIHGLNTLTLEQAMAVQTGDFVIAQVFESAAGQAGQWQIKAMITASGASMRDQTRKRLAQALEGLGIEGVEAELDYHERIMAGVTNDAEIEDRMRGVIRGVVGEDRLVVSEGVIPLFSEDFGSFQDEFPGVMYWLGVSDPESGTLSMPHDPRFVVDEDAIAVGAKTMSAVLLAYLSAG